MIAATLAGFLQAPSGSTVIRPTTTTVTEPLTMLPNSDACKRNHHQLEHHRRSYNPNELPIGTNNTLRDQQYHDYATTTTTTIQGKKTSRIVATLTKPTKQVVDQQQDANKAQSNGHLFIGNEQENGMKIYGQNKNNNHSNSNNNNNYNNNDYHDDDSNRAVNPSSYSRNNNNNNIVTHKNTIGPDFCELNLIQQLPNSLALSALNYLCNIRDSDQLLSRRPQLTSFSSPKLSPTISVNDKKLTTSKLDYNNFTDSKSIERKQQQQQLEQQAYRIRKNSLTSNDTISSDQFENLRSNVSNKVVHSDLKLHHINNQQSDIKLDYNYNNSKTLRINKQEGLTRPIVDASYNLQKLEKNMQIYNNEAKKSRLFERKKSNASKPTSTTTTTTKIANNNSATRPIILMDNNNENCDFTSRSKRANSIDKTTNKFYLTIFGLLVAIGLITTCQLKFAHGQQQLTPRSHAQLMPTSSGNPQLSLNNLNGPPQQQLQQQNHPNQQQQQQQQQAGPQLQHRPIASATGPPQPIAGSLVATVNCNKIRGHVTLTPNSQGSVTVSTQITEGPPGEVYQWSVHQFPVKPGAAMCTCSPLILGMKLIDFGEMHGNLPSNQEYSVQSSTLTLFGPDSPVGHSLLLRGLKTGVVACATFLPTSRKSNYRAKFHEPLSGSVTIFQTAFGSSFLSHLMYSNGTRRHSVHRFDLVKSDDDMLLLNSGHRPLTASPSQSSSNTMIIEQREHDNELSQCRRFTSGEPLLRNMTYQLSVSTENFGMRSRTALVLPQIPFETFSSVYVIVYSEHNPLEPIACAPLKFVRPKTAAAKFQTASVQGNVVFSQDSPYDPTQARINLQLPNSDGHSYGIDELPMIIRRKSDTRVCPNIREIIYNPHHIEPSSVPSEGEATSDQYAVGDLSGKYGSLAGKSSERIQVSDFNLPLFGPNSIVGRAMTVYSAEGVAIACSNVELNTPMTTAFATFDYGIQGQFIFRQAQNDCNGDTYVYIEVSRPMQPPPSTATSATNQQQQHNNHDSNNHIRTLDHNWHVHVNPIDSGLDHLSTTECAAAGPHFNPYNTSTSSIYSRDCTPFNVFRCELGDLASKMFTLEIPPYRVKSGQEPDIGKFFGTDIDLPLCGPVSVVNRSVVVHGPDFGMSRLACSTVIEFKPRN